MKRLLHIFFFLYYLVGSMVLPMGNFSAVADIPEMYQHCKTNEDTNLTAVKFLTEHLVNTDGLFNKFDHRHAQKPHKPFHSHMQHNSYQVAVKNLLTAIVEICPFEENITHRSIYSENYRFEQIYSIFHPPTVV